MAKDNIHEHLASAEGEWNKIYGEGSKSASGALKSTNEALESLANHDVMRSTSGAFSSAFDGLKKFGSSVADNVKTHTNTLVTHTNTLTSAVGLPALKPGDMNLDEALSTLEDIGDASNVNFVLYDLIMQHKVVPAFEKHFTRLLLGSAALALLAGLFLHFPLFFCVPLAAGLAAYACYMHLDEHLGWRLTILLFFCAKLSLAVGLWSHAHLPLAEQRWAAREAARYGTLAVTQCFSTSGYGEGVSIAYIAAAHVLLACRGVLERNTTGWDEDKEKED